MSYIYAPKTEAELEKTAAALLAAYPTRRLDRAVDIESILEDIGLELIPRRGFRKYAEGYLATNPQIIVVDESIFTFMPRARFTLAEEVCHLVLEYGLLTGGKIPKGAASHELSEKQHIFVEKDAKTLASMVLMPAAEFAAVFNTRLAEFTHFVKPDTTLYREVLKRVAELFQVSQEAAFYRAKKLRLIPKSVLDKYTK